MNGRTHAGATSETQRRWCRCRDPNALDGVSSTRNGRPEVREENAKLQATEYWGLSPNWVWPSSTATVKTFKFTYVTTYTVTNTTQFKSTCDTVFGAGLAVYQKHSTATF